MRCRAPLPSYAAGMRRTTWPRVAVSLANVLSARSMKDRVTFVADDFQQLYKDLLPPAFEVQVRSLH